MNIRAGKGRGGRAAKALAGAAALVAAAAPAAASETIAYTYDARGRLVQVAHSGTVNDGVTTNYTFDKADNRTNVTVAGAASGTASSFSIADAVATEGDDVAFVVTRSGGTGTSASVNFVTAGVTANGGTDYWGTTPSNGVLTFAPGETSKTILVHTIQDNVPEPTETFQLNLSNPSAGTTITRSQAIGTILDDD